VTRHVGTDPNVDGRRRAQPEVREKTGDSLHVIERDMQALGDVPERLRGEVSVLVLGCA
jgi:hypothetical protein